MKEKSKAELVYSLFKFFRGSTDRPRLEHAADFNDLYQLNPDWRKIIEPLRQKDKKKEKLRNAMCPKSFEWKGWDWTEISERVGVDITQDEEYIVKQTRKKINDLIAHCEYHEEIITEFRLFLVKLNCGDITSFSSVLAGIYEITDNASFLGHLNHYLEYLWN